MTLPSSESSSRSSSLTSQAPSAVASTVWLIGEKLISLALTLAVTLVLARHLSPHQFGELNFLISIVALLGPFAAMGLNAIVTRELVNRPEDSAQIIGSSLIMRFTGAIVCGLVVLSFSDLFLPGELNGLFLMLLLGNVFNALLVFDYWIQAHVANRYAAKMRLFVLIIMSVIRMLAVYYDASLSLFVYMAAAEMALIGIGFIVLYRVRGESLLKLRFNLAEAKGLLSQSWLLMLSGMAAIIYLKMDQVMLGTLSTQEEVGIYAVAAKLSEVWYFFPAAIVTSFFPQLLAARKHEPKQYAIKLQQLNDILFASAFIIALLVQWLAPWVVVLLFGSDYAASAAVLVIHIWAGVFIFMRTLLSKWLLAEGLLKFSLITQLTGALFNVLFNLWLIPIYGAVGAAIATVISYTAASYLALFCHKTTWPMAAIMTRSMLLPIRCIYLRSNLYK